MFFNFSEDLLDDTTSESDDSEDYASSDSSGSEAIHHGILNDLEPSINSDESDSLITKTKCFKYNVNRGHKSSFKKHPRRSETSASLPCPANLNSFSCPLNALLYHINHHHHQQTNFNTNQNQSPM